METKGKRKKINNRADQPHTETWYRDRLKHGHKSLPVDLFDSGEREDPRELIYKAFAREQRNKRITNAVTLGIVILGISYLIFSFGFKS